MMTIGKYGIRQFQVSDVEEKYSFKEYVSARIITTAVMIIASLIYVSINHFTGLYSFEKCVVIILICLAKAVDAFEDVFHAMFQQYLRLDVAAKILTIRMFTYIVVYLSIYLVTNSLMITSFVALVISLIQFIVLNYIALQGIQVRKKSIQCKDIVSLLMECFPLFIAAYLVMYIGNAPKYAIDKVMSSEAQACFTYIFMPVFVISLLSQFVYQPVISKLALLWHKRNMQGFNKLIFRQIILILGLSIVAVVGGYFWGIPVLSLIYGVNLDEYKMALLILLLGGGALALVNFLQMIITVARKQNLLNFGYLLAFLAFILLGKTVVKEYGIVGISIFYTAAVSGIGIVFGIMTALIIMKNASEK